MIKKENKKYIRYMIKYLKTRTWFKTKHIAEKYICEKLLNTTSIMRKAGREKYKKEIREIYHIYYGYIALYKQCGYRLETRSKNMYKKNDNLIKFLNDLLNDRDYIRKTLRNLSLPARGTLFQKKSRGNDYSEVLFSLDQTPECSSHFRELYKEVMCK